MDPMVVGAAMLVVGLIIGFLLGTRAKQILATFQAIASGAWRSAFSLRIPDDVKSSDDNDAEASLSEPPAMPVVDIVDFLTSQTSNELDENPGLVVNPVLLHVVREAKRAEKLQAQRAAMQRRTNNTGVMLTQEEIDNLEADMHFNRGIERLPNRRRAINVLVENGARFNPVENVADAQKSAAQAARREARNIAVYFSKNHEIDIHATEAVRRRNYIGTWMPTAVEKASETQHAPWQGKELKRQTKNVLAARDGRTVLRQFKHTSRYKEFRQAQLDRERDNKELEAHLKSQALEQVSAEFAEAQPNTETYDAYDDEEETERGERGDILTLGDMRQLAEEFGGDAGEGVPLTTERGERNQFGTSRSTPPSSRRKRKGSKKDDKNVETGKKVPVANPAPKEEPTPRVEAAVLATTGLPGGAAARNAVVAARVWKKKALSSELK